MPKIMNLGAYYGLTRIVPLGEETTAVTYETLKPILDSVTAQFSVANIVSMIAGLVGICVVFVFLWWGARKGFSAIKAAVMRGKLKM